MEAIDKVWRKQISLTNGQSNSLYHQLPLSLSLRELRPGAQVQPSSAHWSYNTCRRLRNAFTCTFAHYGTRLLYGEYFQILHGSTVYTEEGLYRQRKLTSAVFHYLWVGLTVGFRYTVASAYFSSTINTLSAYFLYKLIYKKYF